MCGIVGILARGAAARLLTSIRGRSDQSRKLAALVRENGRLVHPYFLARMLFTPEQRAALPAAKSAPDVSHGASADVATKAGLRAKLECTRTMDAVNRVSYLEARCYMLNTLLRDSDFMSMAHGLEVARAFDRSSTGRGDYGATGRVKVECGYAEAFAGWGVAGRIAGVDCPPPKTRFHVAI